jgi:hypothetical protein
VFFTIYGEKRELLQNTQKIALLFSASLVLCVLFSTFGLWSCSDASADSTPADNTELTARVAALEAVVATLQSNSGIRVFYPYERAILGYALNIDLEDITLLTPNGYVLYGLTFAGNIKTPKFYFDRPYCEGNAFTANDDYPPYYVNTMHRVLFFDNEFYRVTGSIKGSPFITPKPYASYCDLSRESYVNESGSLNAWLTIDSIDEQTIGLSIDTIRNFQGNNAALMLLAPNQPLPPY